MKPGRELDALVAEKVMGWKFVAPGSTISGFVGWVPATGPPERNIAGIQPPPYSTDIAAAWGVVERMRRTWVPQLFQSDENETLWRVEFSRGVDVVRAAEAPTAPHAICLAALKAVGVEF